MTLIQPMTCNDVSEEKSKEGMTYSLYKGSRCCSRADVILSEIEFDEKLGFEAGAVGLSLGSC